eukprot:4970433-Pleurochrysis_carterae.AAC.2
MQRRGEGQLERASAEACAALPSRVPQEEHTLRLSHLLLPLPTVPTRTHLQALYVAPPAALLFSAGGDALPLHGRARLC